MSEARGLLPELVQLALYKNEPTTITRRGRRVAVLVSVDWYAAHNWDDDTSVNQSGALPENPGAE